MARVLKKPARSGTRTSGKSGWAAYVAKTANAEAAAWKKKAEEEKAAKEKAYAELDAADIKIESLQSRINWLEYVEERRRQGLRP